MRILFLTHYFPPEVNAPANRTHEHCLEWVRAGHEVHVVTCVPSHPVGEPFPGYRRGWYQYEQVDGIHVHRVWTYLAKNKGLVKRTLNFLSFVPTAAYRALRLGQFDIAIGTSPQFFCAVAVWVAAALKRIPWVFEVRDLWPESIPAVGAMRPSIALRLLERLELRMYHDASAVVCVTQSFVTNLSKRMVPPEKLHVISNGVIPDFWAAGDRDGVRLAAGVAPGTIIASYVGTVGMAHGLGAVLDAAAMLSPRTPRVEFWIVGDGAELESLRARATSRGLNNVRFVGLVPRHTVANILAASDVSLVTLRPSDVFKAVLPSKMFESMAAGIPIVLAVEGEARDTLDRAQAGIAVAPANASALANAVAVLADDAAFRNRLGAAGREFVNREFSRRTWAAHYLTLLEALIDTKGTAPATLAADDELT